MLKTIKRESYSLSAKFFWGVVIVSSLLFCLYQLASAYIVWLSQYENYNTFLILNFGLLSIPLIFALYMLYRSNKNTKTKSKNSIGIDLALEFGQGFVESYLTNKENSPKQVESFSVYQSRKSKDNGLTLE